MRRLLVGAGVLVALAEPPRFTAVQPDLFGAGASMTNAWADVDGDGDADLFVGFNGTPNRLYRNDHGTFTDVAASLGVADPRPTRAAAWGDYDGDGDPDLLVGFAPGGGSVLRLYRHDGAHFTDVTSPAGVSRDSGAVRQESWVDLDGDGDLDLFVAFRDRPNALFRNDAGVFRDIAPDVGLADPRKTVGAVWFDLDRDGDLDLATANMDGDANALFRNDRGHFTDIADSLGIAWGGRAARDPQNGTVRLCAADVNRDGRFDLIAANYGLPGLFLNRGTTFENVASSWGIAIDSRYDTCALADYDNDGRLDLYLNGTVTGGVSYRDYLFHNDGTRFVDETPENIQGLQADHGAQWGDFDGDGDADLALTGSRPDGMHALLRNDLDDRRAGNSLAVRVLDRRGRATRQGAEVRLYAAGTRRLLGMGLVDTGSGYDAQNDLPVLLGTAGERRVDVEVTYPNGARRVTTRLGRLDPRHYAGRAVPIRVN